MRGSLPLTGPPVPGASRFGHWVVVLALTAACSSTAPGADAGPPDAAGPATSRPPPTGGAPSAPQPPAAGTGAPAAMPGAPARVVRVIDGDTVEVVFRGTVLVIRLIGIDTPETVAPGQAVMCYGPEATRFTRSRLEGRRVNLEFDVERLDPFGRTLAYVWVDGELFNEVLVARGYASVSTFPPNVRYVDRFVDAQRRAREAGRGFWGACAADAAAAADGARASLGARAASTPLATPNRFARTSGCLGISEPPISADRLG